MNRIPLLLMVCLVAAVSVGCQSRKPVAPAIGPIDFAAELPAGQMALRKIGPDTYPKFGVAQNDLGQLRAAIDHSIYYLRQPSSKRAFPYLDITHDRAMATVVALRAVLDELGPSATNSDQFNRLIIERFDIYQSYGAPDPQPPGFTNQVLFTGYFTPIYPASLQQTPEFRYPLYQRPPELVSDPVTGDVNPPFLSRREIEQRSALRGRGLELVWLKDRFDAYVITVQGSARLRLTDGRILEVGYAGHNGHAYVAPGLLMVRDGVIPRGELSLKRLRTYFASNPGAMDTYLLQNDRYVFFAERPGGPFGSLNVPVTPRHTLATDKAVYPRAMPAFVITQVPAMEGNTAYRGFMLDQDTGGAIRAAGRADIYMGVGPEAEALAGRQLNAGLLYYIAVKAPLVPQYLPPAATADVR